MKIGIIGMGRVGASVASSVLHGGVARELLLCDRDQQLAEGEALDLAHGAAFYPAASVQTCAVEDMNRCDAVVIAAGRNGRPGETRLDLLRDNATLAVTLGRQLSSFGGLVVVVSNPVDVLTRIITEASGLPPARVLGTGCLLDTARLRHAIGRELQVDPRSIHANVLGEHGDSEVVAWSSAQMGGTSLRQLPAWSAQRESAISAEVRTAAYEIIRRKGATNHAIGLATAALLRWALRDERRMLTVTTVHSQVAGGVAMSLPAVVGAQGIVQIVEPTLADDERQALERSAHALRDAWVSVTARSADRMPPRDASSSPR